MLRIEEILKGYIGDRLVGRQAILDVDADLLASGMVDSLGMMWLVTKIEQEFGIRVPPQDFTIEHFGSIRAIGDYVTKQIAD